MTLISLASHTLYSDTSLRDLNHEKARIESSRFLECIFENCFLGEAALVDCRFVNCEFIQCDLSLATLVSCVFSGVRFRSSRLLGLDWTAADWKSASLGAPPHFEKCILNHSTFIGLELRKMTMIDSAARDVDFREADLSSADFSGTDLKDALFLNTNLSQADLSKAVDYTIAADKNTIRGAKFSLPEAMSLLFNLDINLVELQN